MDIQNMLDTMSNSMRDVRKQYHLTLGGLISNLRGVPKDYEVIVDHAGNMNMTLDTPNSYRGYYHDLAFSSREASDKNKKTVGEFLVQCRESLGATFEGYKGGEFVMEEDTPLWISDYGVDSGVAIIGIEIVPKLPPRLGFAKPENGKVVIKTKLASPF